MFDPANVPDVLNALMKKFWKDNEGLQMAVLQDIYVRGEVSNATNEAARDAVNRWLNAGPNVND